MLLAVSKDVQCELLAIRADLQMAVRTFAQFGRYGAAERMLVIIDRSLNNLIRDAAVLVQMQEELGAVAVAAIGATAPENGPRRLASDADDHLTVALDRTNGVGKTGRYGHTIEAELTGHVVDGLVAELLGDAMAASARKSATCLKFPLPKQPRDVPPNAD
jgi:hypothetical protein